MRTCSKPFSQSKISALLGVGTQWKMQIRPITLMGMPSPSQPQVLSLLAQSCLELLIVNWLLQITSNHARKAREKCHSLPNLFVHLSSQDWGMLIDSLSDGGVRSSIISVLESISRQFGSCSQVLCEKLSQSSFGGESFDWGLLSVPNCAAQLWLICAKLRVFCVLERVGKTAS